MSNLISNDTGDVDFEIAHRPGFVRIKMKLGESVAELVMTTSEAKRFAGDISDSADKSEVPN